MRDLAHASFLSPASETEEQAEFVQWWRDTVSVRHAANSKDNADRRSPLSLAEAEKLTDIKQQQVSKWAKRSGGTWPHRCG